MRPIFSVWTLLLVLAPLPVGPAVGQSILCGPGGCGADLLLEHPAPQARRPPAQPRENDPSANSGFTFNTDVIVPGMPMVPPGVPAPVSGLPMPPPGQPPVGFRYACGSAPYYYPYVETCRTPWQAVRRQR